MKKISEGKRKLITAALALLAAGALIICVGLGFNGFDKEQFTEKSEHPWYRTIGFDSDGSFFWGWHD